MVKIVTYNVNGLRPRVAQHGSLRRLLDALDADIICFQETKLSRQDLSGDVIMAEGYEAFISCNRSSKGRGAYSGVATFCRVTSAFSSQEVALPVAAEEGFTGLQETAKNSETIGDFVLVTPVEEEGLGEVTKEELLKVDNEGRCVITDHGHFVLFNIYGPAVEEDDIERVRFKLLFYKILQIGVMPNLDSRSKQYSNMKPLGNDKLLHYPFPNSRFRKWLRSMLREHGGPFFDAFRSKHPERVGAYTCFNQKVGAEVYNYGSRIDHILISGACFHHCGSVDDHSIFPCHVEECEIMDHFRRGNSENMSMWKGGRSSKLEGSDHIPVYIVLNEIPELPVHNTPSSAARYLPEIRGRQQSIVSFLRKGMIYEHKDAMSMDRADESCCGGGLESKAIYKEEPPTDIAKFSKGNDLHSVIKRKTRDQLLNEGSSGNSHNSTAALLATQSRKASFSCSKAVSNKKNKHNLSSQPTIKSFFQQPKSKPGDSSTNSIVTPPDTLHGMDELHDPKNDCLPESIQCTTPATKDQGNSDVPCSLSTDKCNEATLEWQRIQQRMKMTLPLCKGHHEPCIPRSVKKGSNIGRLFYVCARAQVFNFRINCSIHIRGTIIKGPASNQEANCGHFQWATVKSKEKRR
uniref:DNA-(apurinic or apyrimidinic site) endonuclease 2 n=1 Tax=Oryza barthii TaxID=65489 RepID=A0A0D3H9E2_9ORYZ